MASIYLTRPGVNFNCKDGALLKFVAGLNDVPDQYAEEVMHSSFIQAYTSDGAAPVADLSAEVAARDATIADLQAQLAALQAAQADAQPAKGGKAKASADASTADTQAAAAA